MFPRMLLVLLFVTICLAAADVNCPENTNWTPDDRKAILEVHNVMRTKIREGKYVALKDKKAAAKPGTMPNLVYNCTVEKSAQKWADTCPGLKHSQTPGYGENMASTMHYEKPANFIDAGEKASRMWEDEFIKKGWPCNKMTEELYEFGVAHATQMAWAKTTQIGCGVKLCSNAVGDYPYETMVVCQYYPQGNVLSWMIYETENGVEPPCTVKGPPSPTDDSTSSKSSSQLSLHCLLVVLSWYPL